ncbi:DUF3560 domain-containing protein [Paraliomyxa miuraensis]|uniref:DUF3560 domain-containing protein n=1 Tax=Paraliomyxa miuraensis TaxID=376150 RepID=UPI00224D6B12|nr:DUF3560 domain-containing protein [Paraliomyxa miuraensis]
MTTPKPATKPSEVVVRYRYADGILLEGDSYPHKEAVKKSHPRWRWFRSLRKWGAPRTRDRALSRYQVEEYARGLRAAGVPNVRVDYQEPMPEHVRDFGEVVEERKERALDRAERLEERADRLEGEAAAEYGKHRAVLDRIPFGQPILVGHHSEGRHRRDLERADASMRRSVEASKGAKDARRQAKAAEHGAAQHEKPGFALRRVVELGKEARELQVKITGEVPTGWRGHDPGGPATGEWLAQLQTFAEENRQKMAHYRRVLDEAGYMPSSQAVLRKGDRVLTDKGGAVVQKPLSQHVELRFDHAVRWTSGPQYVKRAVYSRVWVPKATVERNQAQGSSSSTEAPKASSGAAAGSPGPLTMLVTKHRDAAKRYTVQQIIDALVEAERLGVGEKLARYFRATLKDQDVQRAYGRARGIVAFERDGWPPSPLRGQTYGAQDFGGLLESLDHEPTVAQLLAELQAFPERMQPITGARHSNWFRTLIRETANLLGNHHNEYERKVAQGQAATPDFARMAMEALVAKAAHKLHELRLVQDPSLYDPKSDPKDVYPRLCEIDSETARKILVDVFKIDFHPEDEEDEAAELCKGEITLETLAEGAAQRAEEERARKEQERAQRQADARELLKVHREAASRGEVTKGRFNAAYWRLHPGFEKPARSRRALMMTERDGKVVAVVRGPIDMAFGVRLPGGTDEQAAIAALMRQVAQEAGEAVAGEAVAGEVATPGKTTKKGKPSTKAKSSAKAERTTKVDVEALAKKLGLGDSKLNGHEIHPILVEAERQGVGQQMAQLIAKRELRYPDQVKIDLGRARGAVAQENDAWPPPPLRGAVYGKHDFEGLILSLGDHPLVVELHREASTWAERMAPITDDRARHWFPKLVEQARLVVHDHLDVPLHQIRNGNTTPTPDLVLEIRDATLRDAEKLLGNLRDALDPSLYDPKSDPEAVYPRLCKIDFESARWVMMDVFGLRFEDRHEALELCRGDTSIDEVSRKAKARNEEIERREAARQAEREADARDLLAVYRTAQKLGEVSRKRFNLAYWRQHPDLGPSQRESRALRIRTRRGEAELIVRGPREQGFHIPVQPDAAEPEAIAAAMREIEKVANQGAAPARAANAEPAPEPKPAPDQPDDTTVADAIEEEPTADENDAPRGEAAPGSLWSVEEEGFALTAPPGEGKRVQVPTGHQPALFDVGKPDPAVLERMRADELAERRAKRPPPDTSDPLLAQATSEPSAADEDRAAPPERPSAAGAGPTPSTADENQTPAAPMMRMGPWVGEIQTVANRMGDEGRHGDDFVLISAVWKAVQDQPLLAGPSLDAFKARLVRANRDGLLRLHAADPNRPMDPELARESEIRDGNATLHVIEATPPLRQPAPAGRRHPFEPLPSTQRLAPGVIERQVRAILTNRIADDGPNGVSEFSTKHEPRHVRVIKAMAKRGVVKLVKAPRGYVRIMAGPKWGATEEPKPKPPAKPKPTAKKAGGSRSKQKAARSPKATSPHDAINTTIREGGIVAFQHEESGSTTRFGLVVRVLPGNRAAEIHAPQWFPLTGIRAVQSGGDPEFNPSLKRYYLDELTNVRPPVPSDIGPDGLRLMKRATKNWVDLRPVGGGPSWDAFVALRNLGLMHRNKDVDLGGQDGDWPGPPFVVEPTDLGQKVLASLDPAAVNLATRVYVTPRHRNMGPVFPIGEDLGGPDENVWFYVLEETFEPTDESRGYPVGMVVVHDDFGSWRVLDGFSMGPLNDDPEWDDEHAYPDEWAARRGLKEQRREHVQRLDRERRVAEEERIWGPEGPTWGFPPLGHEDADETLLDRKGSPDLSNTATERQRTATTKDLVATEAAGLTNNAPAANNRPPPPEPPVTIAPIDLSPALARRVRAEQAKLHTLPKHGDPSFRPVVVVAWEGRRRPDVFSRYHTEPLGALVTIDGHYDRAQIVAELGPHSGPPHGGGRREPSDDPPSPSSHGSTSESSPPPLDSFEEDLMRSLLDQGDDGIEPDNADEARALEGMEGRGLVEKTEEDRYRATPLARLEYVDVATGVPTDPGEPGTLSTGRIVADIDGETVEVDEEDLIGRGTDPDPRKRRYRFDVDSPADYPGQAKAKRTAREAEQTAGTKNGKGKKGKAAVAGLRATFDSPAKAAKIFYDQNIDFLENVVDPWDGLRDWMDGIEVRVGRGHRKLSKTPAGQRILEEKHASRAIRGALAYLMGQAKGRRWEAVPWDQIERLGEALQRYFEEPSASEPSMSGLYWRPFAGKVRAEDLDVMTPDQRASIREQESVKEIGEQLDELKEAYERAKDCLPDDLRRVIERRVAEWSRWVDNPSKIPDYACEPDPETAGYLCNYPAVAGELRQLRKSCEDAYDPNWAAKDSKEGAPGFPDTSHGEDEELPPRTASAKACCSRETPKEEVCSAPVCQIAAGLKEEPKADTATDAQTAKEPTTKAAPEPAKHSGKAGKPSSETSKPPTKTSTAKKASRSATHKAAPKATATKPTPKRKLTAAERRKALAERKKAAEQRRKQTAAERRAQRFQCSAAVAVKQAEAIDTTSYRRRVEDAAAAIKKAEEHVKHHERDLKAAIREADAVMRNRKAIPMDREVARRKVREARCQLSVAQGTLRQRKRDHQRAQTELERARGRVRRREAVAAKRLEETKKAEAEAATLAKSR